MASPVRLTFRSPYAIWSIRVPCPGGSGASNVGCGRRVPSFASGFFSGVLAASGAGAAIGEGEVTLETLICENPWRNAADHDGEGTNALSIECLNRRPSRPMPQRGECAARNSLKFERSDLCCA